MIIVDETVPIGELPPPFPAKNVEVKTEEDIRDYYDLKKEIGRGRFGTVYLCSCKTTGIKFAAKFVKTKRNKDRENVEREIEVMKVLNEHAPHPRLIQLYDAFDMGKEMCLVLEVVEGGELFERVIDDDFVLTERACAIFIKQICEGIEFIHTKNVLHLDMKPENILCLSREGNRVKICDFGLARRYDPRKKLQVLFGTPEFVAPEVVNFDPISFGTDMWSVGVICYVLLSGLSPFMGHNYVETMTNVTHNKYDFDDEAFEEVSDDVKDFIERLLMLDKSERLTPAQCIRHPWIKTALSSDPPKKTVIDTQTLVDVNINIEFKVEVNEILQDSKQDNENNNIVPEFISENDKSEATMTLSGESQSKVADLNLKSCEEYQNIALTSNENDNVDNAEFIKEQNLKADGNDIHKNVLIEAMVKEKDHLDNRMESHSPHHSLEITKKQLKEFVDRWNSHPNSPYIVASPKDSSEIFCIDASELPHDSFASTNVEPPSRTDASDLEDDMEVCNEDLLQNNIKISLDATSLPPEEMVRELGHRLRQLEQDEPKTQTRKRESAENKLCDSESSKRPKVETQEKVELAAGPLRKRPSADGPLKTATAAKDTTKKSEKDPSSVKLKPSRDVPVSIEKNEKQEVKKSLPTTPDRTSSPVSSPARRSRRHSRDERPSSRGSDRNTPVRMRRRPSRDIPLTISQVDKLAVSSCISIQRNMSQEIWPDMICVSHEKDSDSDDQSVTPITVKLELPVVITSTGPHSIEKTKEHNQELCSYKGPTKIEKSKGVEKHSESTKEGKIVTWLLDIGAAKQQSEICQNTEIISFGDTLKNNKETHNIDSESYHLFTPLAIDTGQMDSTREGSCSPISPPILRKRDSSSSLKSSGSSDNLTVHTPWGPMRRSPSKTSLTTSNNTNIIFININDFSKEDHSPKKKTPQISVATPVSKLVEKKENIKAVSDSDDVIPRSPPCTQMLPTLKVINMSAPSSSQVSPAFSDRKNVHHSSVSPTSKGHSKNASINLCKTDVPSFISPPATSVAQLPSFSQSCEKILASSTPIYSVAKSKTETSPSQRCSKSIDNRFDIKYETKNLNLNSQSSSTPKSINLNCSVYSIAPSIPSSSNSYSTNLFHVSSQNSSSQNAFSTVNLLTVSSQVTPLITSTIKTNLAIDKTKAIEDKKSIDQIGISNSFIKKQDIRNNKLEEATLKDHKENNSSRILENGKLCKYTKDLLVPKIGLAKASSMHDVPSFKLRSSIQHSKVKTEEVTRPNIPNESQNKQEVRKRNPPLLRSWQGLSENEDSSKYGIPETCSSKTAQVSNYKEAKTSSAIKSEVSKNLENNITLRNVKKESTLEKIDDVLENNIPISSKSNSRCTITTRSREDKIFDEHEAYSSKSTNISYHNEANTKDGSSVTISEASKKTENNVSLKSFKNESTLEKRGALIENDIPLSFGNKSRCTIITGGRESKISDGHSLSRSTKLKNISHTSTTSNEIQIQINDKASLPPKLTSPHNKNIDINGITNNVARRSHPSRWSTIEESQNKDIRSKLPPQPSDEVKFQRKSSRYSLIEDSKQEEECPTITPVRRRSKPNTPTSDRKGLGFCLFSAQDRISLFEQKREDTPPTRTQTPFMRSKTSHFFSDESQKESIKSRLGGSSLRESKNRISPSVVSTRV